MMARAQSPLILVLRPEPGASATNASLAAMGLQTRILPLFTVGPVSWEAPDPARFDALALSSANAVRHGGAALNRLKSLPVYAVGDATAQAARESGFTVVAQGSGGIAGLAPMLERNNRKSLLRLVGRHFTPFAAPDMKVETITVYESIDQSVDKGVIETVPEGAVALLYSDRAARTFASLIDTADVPRAHIRLVAISSTVLDAAGDGWAATDHAISPNEASLLSALQNMLEADDPRFPQDDQ